MDKQDTKVYVTMTDKFMSGWGHAQGLTNKLIFECVDMDEAFIIEQNANHRTDMKYINICITKPYYNKNRYYAQLKTIVDYPNWYKANYFYRGN